MAGPAKAYKNLPFLNSHGARHLRILAEYEEPRQRLKAFDVRDTIVFFGSARARPMAVAQLELQNAERAFQGAEGEDAVRRYGHQVKVAKRRVRLSKYYALGQELARRLAEWDQQRQGPRRYLVATGGGPGMMEAANRGASEVPGARNVGLGISLPFEERLNPYVSPELGFEFHYFFMRKYWFLYPCKAMVILPGGFGSMDELFETLTLRQTGKIKHSLPTVLFGGEFWKDIINFQAMVDWGVISEADLLLFQIVDTVDEAFNFLTAALTVAEQDDPSTRNEE